MAGIVAELPSALVSTLELGKTGALSGLLIIFFLFLAVLVIGFIVFMERGQRRILIQYPKRQVGMKVMQGQSSHLPLKINTAGVIPPIFASSILLLPVTALSINAGNGPDWLLGNINVRKRTAGVYVAICFGDSIFCIFLYKCCL